MIESNEERLQKIDQYYNKTAKRAFFYLLVWIDFKDPAIWSLLFSNIFSIFLAITQHWSNASILFVYWLQSIIIGVFNILRMLNVSIESVQESTSLKDGPKSKQSDAVISKIALISMFVVFYWFLMNYYFFGFVVSTLANNEKIDYGIIIIPTLLFFISHLVSFVKNYQKDKKASIGLLAFYPFLRAIPMQFVALPLVFVPNSFASAFLILKTFVDLKSHHWERLKYQQPTEEQKRQMLAQTAEYETNKKVSPIRTYISLTISIIIIGFVVSNYKNNSTITIISNMSFPNEKVVSNKIANHKVYSSSILGISFSYPATWKDIILYQLDPKTIPGSGNYQERGLMYTSLLNEWNSSYEYLDPERTFTIQAYTKDYIDFRKTADQIAVNPDWSKEEFITSMKPSYNVLGVKKLGKQALLTIQHRDSECSPSYFMKIYVPLAKNNFSNLEIDLRMTEVESDPTVTSYLEQAGKTCANTETFLQSITDRIINGTYQPALEARIQQAREIADSISYTDTGLTDN